MIRRTIAWGIVFAGLASGAADCLAQTVIYNDGQTHSISTEVQAEVVVRNDSKVEVKTNGWIRANQLSTRVLDSSWVSLSNGTIWSTTSGPSNAVGISLQDSARFEMTSGDLRGTTSGPGNSLGIDARGNSRVLLRGGIVQATTSSPGNSTGVVLSGGATLEMTGGSIVAITNHIQSFGVVANDMAKVKVYGGDVQTTAFSGSAVDFVANGNSIIAIVGTSWIYQQGIPLSPLSGQVSGQYADGSPFSFSFQRSASATILLVPEPAAGALIYTAALVWSIARPRSRRS